MGDLLGFIVWVERCWRTMGDPPKPPFGVASPTPRWRCVSTPPQTPPPNGVVCGGGGGWVGLFVG